MRIVVVLSWVAVLALSVSAANADPITINVWGDSYLRGGSYAANNYGGVSPIRATNDQGAQKVIFGFDLAGAGITTGNVTDAVLRFYQSTSGGAATYTVYRATGAGSQNWIEGTTAPGAPSTTAVNFNKYDGVNAWTTPGGDYDISTFATGVSTGNNQYVEITVTSLVQAMIDAGNTRATFIIMTNQSTPTTYIEAKEATTHRIATLTVDVPEPATMTLLTIGGLSLLARRRNRA